MNPTADDLVAGVGEVGGPLAAVLSRSWSVARLDIDLDPEVDSARYLHVCYPYQIADFIGTTAAYVSRFAPAIVVVHSTVPPGTTAEVQERVPNVPVFYSPVRGKHREMDQELLSYRKFIAGPEDMSAEVRVHFEAAGMQVDMLSSREALELAKLLETTYFGVLIAWAQETERFARAVGSSYDEVIRFVEEVSFLPSGYFPGVIGGHCVMPNIELLLQVRGSCFLDCVKKSNDEFDDEAG